MSLTKIAKGFLKFYGKTWYVAGSTSLPKATDVFAAVTLTDSTYGDTPAYTTAWLGQTVRAITIGTETYLLLGSFQRSNGLYIDYYYADTNWMVSMELSEHKRIIFCLNGTDKQHWTMITSPDNTKLQMFNATEKTRIMDAVGPSGPYTSTFIYPQYIYASLGTYSGSQTAGTVTCDPTPWLGDGTGYAELYDSTHPEYFCYCSVHQLIGKEAGHVLPPRYRNSVAHHASASTAKQTPSDQMELDAPARVWRGLDEPSLSGGIYDAIKESFNSCVLSPSSDKNSRYGGQFTTARALNARLPYETTSYSGTDYPSICGSLPPSTGTGFQLGYLPAGHDSIAAGSLNIGDYIARNRSCEITVTKSATAENALQRYIITSSQDFYAGIRVNRSYEFSTHVGDPLAIFYQKDDKSWDYAVLCYLSYSFDSTSSLYILHAEAAPQFVQYGFISPGTLPEGPYFAHVGIIGAMGPNSTAIGGGASSFGENSVSLGVTRPDLDAAFQVGLGRTYYSPICVPSDNRHFPSLASPSEFGKAPSVYLAGVGGYTFDSDFRLHYSVGAVNNITRYCGKYAEDFLSQEPCITLTITQQEASPAVAGEIQAALLLGNPLDIGIHRVRRVSGSTTTDLDYNYLSTVQTHKVGDVYKFYFDFDFMGLAPEYLHKHIINGVGDVVIPHLLFTATDLPIFGGTRTSDRFFVKPANKTNLRFGHIICPNSVTVNSASCNMFQNAFAPTTSCGAFNSVEFTGVIELPKVTKIDNMFNQAFAGCFHMTKNASTAVALDSGLSLKLPHVIAPLVTSSLYLFTKMLSTGNKPTGSSNTQHVSRLVSVELPSFRESVLPSGDIFGSMFNTSSPTHPTVTTITIPAYRFSSAVTAVNFNSFFGTGSMTWTSETLTINCPYEGSTAKQLFSQSTLPSNSGWMNQNLIINHPDPSSCTVFSLATPTSLTKSDNVVDNTEGTDTLPVNVSSLFAATPVYPEGYTDWALRRRPKVCKINNMTYNVQQKANPSGVATDPDQYYYLEWDGTTITAHANL